MNQSITANARRPVTALAIQPTPVHDPSMIGRALSVVAFALAATLLAAPASADLKSSMKAVGHTVKEGAKTGGKAAKEGAKTGVAAVKGAVKGGGAGAKSAAKSGGARTKAVAKAGGAKTKAAAKQIAK